MRDCSRCSVAPMQLLPDHNDGDDDEDDDDVNVNVIDENDIINENDDAHLQQLVGFAQFTPILLLPSLPSKFTH